MALAITPARKITGRHSLIKYRRMLGLYSFFYALLHFFCYVWFDKSFHLTKIAKDVVHRQFIAIGMMGFFLLVPLAITSTNKMIKYIGGQRWLKIHRGIYFAGICGVVHYWMSVKADTNRPSVFAVILIVLLGYRLFTSRARQTSINPLKISH